MKRKFEIQQQDKEYQDALKLEDEKQDDILFHEAIQKSMQEVLNQKIILLPNPSITLKFRLPNSVTWIRSYNENETISTILHHIGCELKIFGLFMIYNGHKLPNQSLKDLGIKNKTLLFIEKKD